MKRKLLLLLGVVILSGCAEESTPIEETTVATEPTRQVESPIEWETTTFRQSIEVDVKHVTQILIDERGWIHAGYMDQDENTYVAVSKDYGKTWEATAMPRGFNYIRRIIEREDGTLLLGGGGHGNTSIFYESQDGETWEAFEFAPNGSELPNKESTNVWDMVELNDGSVVLATDSQDNDPTQEHTTVYRLEGDQLDAWAPLPGLGVLSIEVGPADEIYVATEESDEHDDAENAGQARVFMSTDLGQSWEELPVPTGANRIYDLYLDESGTLFAASGIRGEFLRLKSDTDEWETMAPIPSAELPFGNPPELREVEATRIYHILALEDGRLMVGTGNNAGDIFVTSDGGETWDSTDETGPNNVVWAFAQDPETGTIWIGTGSQKGDVLKSEL